jgi:MFS family permease
MSGTRPVAGYSSPITHQSSLARRNALFLGVDLAVFMAALGLLGPLTLVPLFISTLTDDPLAIGLAAAATQIGWLPQVFAAGYVEQSPRRRPWVLGFTGVERLPVLGLAGCALVATSVPAALLLPLIYVCRFSQALAAGLATIPWLDLIARVVPGDQRGRFMGNWTTIGNILGAASGALTVPLLGWLPYPQNFAVCFGLAFVILMTGYLPLFLVVEPAGPPPRPPRPLRRQLGDLPAIVARDAPFRRFLVGLSLTALGTMGTGFLAVYAVNRLSVPVELAAAYTVILLVGTILANLLFGWLADRHGFTAVARTTALTGVGLAGIAISAGLLALEGVAAAFWTFPAFVLLGANQAGSLLTKLAGPLDFAPTSRRPTYVALTSALVSVVAAAAPLLGSQLVATLGYEWLFVASAAFSLAGAVVLGPAAKPVKRADTHHHPSLASTEEVG